LAKQERSIAIQLLSMLRTKGSNLFDALFEIGQIYKYDVFVVDLTESFKERLLKRGAIATNEFDKLQIVETTNLLEPQK